MNSTPDFHRLHHRWRAHAGALIKIYAAEHRVVRVARSADPVAAAPCCSARRAAQSRRSSTGRAPCLYRLAVRGDDGVIHEHGERVVIKSGCSRGTGIARRPPRRFRQQ